MSQRGDYRAVYSVLHDSEEFKRLSKDGKLLWYGVKHSLGLSGIGVLFDDQLAERSGLEPHELEPARQELIRERWIQVEGRVHWLVNGLRFEPNVSVSNPNHVKAIGRHLSGLPKLSIVNRMASYYGLPIPFPMVPPSPSGTDPNGIGDHGAVDVKPLTLDGTGAGTERGSRAREDSLSLNGETPTVDTYEPTEAQRARAAELRVDLDPTLRKWRANRKANPMPIADLAADFDGWLEREPAFSANGSPPRPLLDVLPRPAWTPPPEGPEPTPEERAAGREIIRQAVQAVSLTTGPEKAKAVEAEIARQRRMLEAPKGKSA